MIEKNNLLVIISTLVGHNGVYLQPQLKQTDALSPTVPFLPEHITRVDKRGIEGWKALFWLIVPEDLIYDPLVS